MKLNSIRLRLTLGVLLILTPFLFALSHLMAAVVHSRRDPHVVVVQGPRSDDGLSSLYLMSGLSVTAFAVGTWLIVGRTLSPIRLLAKQAREAHPHERAIRLKAPTRDAEVRELVTTLNDLLDRVDAAASERGRFYAAASHELRTPLQALSGHLELAASKPRTEEEYRRAIDEARGQASRLASLVEDILLLHRLDASKSTQLHEIPLPGALVPLFDASAPAIALHAEGKAKTMGGPSHLEILVSNLISNAIRHGSGDVRASFQANAETRLATLKVENRLGEDRPDLEALNHPFSTAARSRAGDDSGNGLGIAIARTAASASGWDLKFAIEGQIFIATVTFPTVG